MQDDEAAWKLQIIPCAETRDHVPLQLELDVDLRYDGTMYKKGWGRDLISDGLRYGTQKRSDYLDDLEKRLELRARRYDEALQLPDPDAAWDRLVEAVRGSAARHFLLRFPFFVLSPFLLGVAGLSPSGDVMM